MINEKEIQPFTPSLPLQTERGVFNYMSTPTIYGLIRHLCEETGGPYLEIGSYRGQSLLAAGQDTSIKCIGIDNFTGVGYRANNKEILLEQIAPYKNIKLIEADYLEALDKVKRRRFNVIFLDGPHEYGHTSTQMTGTAALLKSGGFMIVDDYIFTGVRNAVLDFLDNYEPEYKIVLKETTKHRNDPKWWNGVIVLQKQKKNAKD